MEEFPLIPPRAPFPCFGAMDARDFAVESIAAFCENLLRSGRAWFCAWGPGCASVHDIMDETIIGSNPPQSSFPDIMTTWHEKDTLEEALDFFLSSTVPPGHLPDDCRMSIITVVGSPVWAAEITRYISRFVT